MIPAGAGCELTIRKRESLPNDRLIIDKPLQRIFIVPQKNIFLTRAERSEAWRVRVSRQAVFVEQKHGLLFLIFVLHK